MTPTHLRACPSCSRHVRVSEAACPFCGAAFSASFRGATAPRAPAARLTRAALFAFGTGGAALTAACGSSSSGPPPQQAQPAYGGPAQEVDGGAERGDAGRDGSEEDATPGDDASPETDAGPAIDAFPATDAPAAPETGTFPVYGAPPIPPDAG
jgi:hypothetical protein